MKGRAARDCFRWKPLGLHQKRETPSILMMRDGDKSEAQSPGESISNDPSRGTAIASNGQSASLPDARRAIALLQLEGLANIPGLLHRAEATLGNIKNVIAGLPDVDDRPAIDAHQHALTRLREAASRLLRQLREQRLMLDDLLASPEAMSDAAWIQIEAVVRSIWPWRQDGTTPGGQGRQETPGRIARALGEIDGQLAARVDSLQNCLVDIDQRQLGLNQLHLRRTFHLSAE